MYQKIINYVEEVFKNNKDNSVVGFTKKGFINSITKKYENNLAKGLSEEDAYNLAISQTPEIHSVAKDMEKVMGRRDPEADNGYTENSGYTEHNAYTESSGYTQSSGYTENNGCAKANNTCNDEFHYSNNTTPSEDFEKSLSNQKKIKTFFSIFWPLVIAACFLVGILFGGRVWRYTWLIIIAACVVQAMVTFFFAKTPNDKKGALSGSLWLLIVAVYLACSFSSGLWRYTWILFLIGAALQCLIDFFTAKTRQGKRAAVGGSIWLILVVLYFSLSYLTGRWDVTWIIFILGIAVHSIAMLIFDKFTLK